jgi:hypothetical protein
MGPTYVVSGTLTNGDTLHLDRLLPLPETRVRVTVEPLPKGTQESYVEVIQAIRVGQNKRGFRPPSRAEVDKFLKAERDSWE